MPAGCCPNKWLAGLDSFVRPSGRSTRWREGDRHASGRPVAPTTTTQTTHIGAAARRSSERRSVVGLRTLCRRVVWNSGDGRICGGPTAGPSGQTGVLLRLSSLLLSERSVMYRWTPTPLRRSSIYRRCRRCFVSGQIVILPSRSNPVRPSHRTHPLFHIEM